MLASWGWGRQTDMAFQMSIRGGRNSVRGGGGSEFFIFEHLKDVYVKQIRSILEYGVPVWHSSLTIGDMYGHRKNSKVSFKDHLKP